MNTPVGDRLFQDIPRRVAKLRENRPRDIEKSVVGKKHTTKTQQSPVLWKATGSAKNNLMQFTACGNKTIKSL